MSLDNEFANRERSCPICGRVFLCNPDWVYRKGSSDHEWIFCSWRCLRKWEKEQAHPLERRQIIISKLMDGKTVLDVANEMHEDRSKVQYWYNKLKKEGLIDERKAGSEGSSGED